MGLSARWRFLFLFLPTVILYVTAPAQAGPAEIPIRVLSAATTEYDELTNRWVFQGNVVVEYRDYRVTADVAEVDPETQTATFRGRVKLTTPERTIEGTLLSLNLRTRGYTLEGARIVIPPEDLQIGASSPVYATSARIIGVPGRIYLERGGVTTCNLAHPHYLFGLDRLNIILGERLRAHNISVYAFGHKLLTLPGISIPLRTINEQSTRLVPTVGQSIDEGYYVKTFYYYALGALLGSLRLDVMSKKGIGIGADQPYNFSNNDGRVYLYWLNDTNSKRQDIDTRITHRQRLGEFNIQLGNDYRRNTLIYLPTSVSNTNLISDLMVTRQGRDGTASTFGLNRSESSFSGTSTGNWIGRLTHAQTFGKIQSNLNLNLNQPFGQATASAGTLTSHLDLTRPSKQVDMNLVVDWIDTLGNTANFFTGIQRLPELRIATSTNRLLSQGFFTRTFPVAAELSLGNLQESAFTTVASGQSNAVDRIRTALRLSANPQVLPPESKLSLYSPLEFNQFVYKTDEAQWVFNANPSLSYRLGPASQIGLNYSYLTHNGFTPFQADFYPRYNHISLALRLGSSLGGNGGAYPGYGTGAIGSVGPLTGYGGYPGSTAALTTLDPRGAGKANFTLGTGFDFENNLSQDLIVRAQYQPTAHYLMDLSSGYDWTGKTSFGTQSRLRNIRGRLRVDYGPLFQFGLGTLWNTTENRFSAVKATLNTRLGRWWQLQSLYGNTTFSSSSSQRYTQVMLTRDLHCWDASFLFRTDNFYGSQRPDYRFFMVIKAFPVNKQFGVSTSGQYLTTDIGEIY